MKSTNIELLGLDMGRYKKVLQDDQDKRELSFTVDIPILKDGPECRTNRHSNWLSTHAKGYWRQDDSLGEGARVTRFHLFESLAR